MGDLRTTAARVVVAASVLGFVGTLAWYLPKPGYTHVRLAFFVVLAGLAVGGGVGAVRREPRVAAVAAAGLFLLGFWQAVLWVFIFPVAGVIVIGALVIHPGSNAEDPAA